jgi:hypothetical protein
MTVVHTPFINNDISISNGESCLICETPFERRGYYRQSWTFGFCCELCVSKASRTANRQNRRLRKRGDIHNSRGKLSCVDWIACLLDNNFGCKCCNVKSRDLTCDHIVPISHGGLNMFHNIQPLCRSCHNAKDNIRSRKDNIAA